MIGIQTVEDLRPLHSATTLLYALRDAATIAGFEKIGDDCNQRIRYGSRIYDLDAGYSSGAVWAKVSYRRAGKPARSVLGTWNISNFDSDHLRALLAEIRETIQDQEDLISGGTPSLSSLVPCEYCGKKGGH